MVKREFAVRGADLFDRSSVLRWMLSHLLKYKPWVASFLLGTVLANLLNGGIPILIGRAFNTVLHPTNSGESLTLITGEILALVLVRAGFDLTGRFSAEILGKRFKRDARDELFASLLGKSQTWHNRQPHWFSWAWPAPGVSSP